jgi:MFS family permease
MQLKKAGKRLYAEIGVDALVSSPPDAKVLFLQRLVRLFAYGGTTLILALHLSDLGFSDTQTGMFMTLTLVGDVLISLILTLCADKIGRRLTLTLGSILMAGSGMVFALSNNYWHLLIASILGVISPR